MTPEQINWVKAAVEEATAAAHVFPEMAACEAALESNFGESELAKDANNLFGMKQHRHPQYGTFNLPTREFEASDNKWIVVNAAWVEYPSIAKCFEDRIHTLSRLATEYPNYARALTSPNAQKYIEWVSKTWSTDPDRATKVETIFQEVFGQPVASELAEPPEAGIAQTSPSPLPDSTPAETGTDGSPDRTPPETSEAPATEAPAPPPSELSPT